MREEQSEDNWWITGKQIFILVLKGLYQKK